MNNHHKIREVIVCFSIILVLILFIIGASMITNSLRIDQISVPKSEIKAVPKTIQQPILLNIMRQLDDILRTTNDITKADIQLKALQNALIDVNYHMRNAQYLDYEGLMYHQWLIIEIAKRQKLMEDR